MKSKLKLNNKFYVASQRVLTPEAQREPIEGMSYSIASKWPRATLNAAIKHAAVLLTNEPALEYCVIVKMIKVVRRVNPRVAVDDIK